MSEKAKLRDCARIRARFEAYDGPHRAQVWPIVWWDFTDYGFPVPPADVMEDREPPPHWSVLVEALVACGYNRRVARNRVFRH